MASSRHRYPVEIRWSGRGGDEPWAYRTYSRSYVTCVPGKPDLAGSADPAFHGDRSRHNPEDLFVAAVSACHMLTYLALCAFQGIAVLQYRDAASGELRLEAGRGGRFTSVELRPTVTVADGADLELAERLHARAHRECFIANSCAVAIRCHPTVSRKSAGPGGRQ